MGSKGGGAGMLSTMISEVGIESASLEELRLLRPRSTLRDYRGPLVKDTEFEATVPSSEAATFRQ